MPKNKLEHIAFILDGNKRWAKRNRVNIKDAYKEGLENINNLIDISLNLKLKYLTLFTLSSENIKRKNVSSIFQIIFEDFEKFLDKIISQKLVKINVIGSSNNLPKKIINLITNSEEETKKNKDLILNLAFNYGFKDEIRRVLTKVQKHKINTKNFNEINKLFFLGTIPDPDILIRTGGEKRLSNFIMYNLTYTEIFFINTLWPDFSRDELVNIIKEYKKISRRYGL